MSQTSANAQTRHFTDADFGREVLRSDRPVLVDFYADWCPPCRLLAPTIDAVAAEVGDRALVGKLNVDDNPETARAYGVSSIPTVLVFRGGQLVERFVGVQRQDRYVAALTE